VISAEQKCSALFSDPIKGSKVRFDLITGGVAIYPEQDPIDYYRGILGGRGFPMDFEREPDREIE
jgi:hypothetical protein